MIRIKSYVITLVAFFALTMFSCEDETGLSEEEILELASTVGDVRIRVLEFDENIPLTEATVSVRTLDGVLTTTTDEAGIASFTGLEQGEYFITVQQEGYVDFNDEVDIFVGSGRSSSEDLVVELYSMNKVARIRGRLIAQIDLTTEAYEAAAGVTITALEDNENIAVTTTADDGSFLLEVPTSRFGRRVSLSIPSFIADQTLAVREGSEVVEKTVIGTVFDPFKAAAELPNTANIIIGLPSPTLNGGRQEYVESIEVEFGTITNVTLSGTGYGYSFFQNVTEISSPDGGSDAELVLETFSDFSFCSPFWGRLSGIRIDDGGFDYPDYEPNQNVPTEQPEGFYWDSNNCTSIDRDVRLRLDDVYTFEFNYGTGAILGEIQ